MFKNYFRIAVRNLIKNKIFSFINVFGLAVGLTCCMLIAAFLFDELSYDKYPEHANQIYRLGLQVKQNGGVADYPDVDVAVGAGIKNTFPEVLASTRINGAGNIFFNYKNKQFKEQHIAFCDSNFLQIFSIPLIEGDDRTALVAPNSIVITKAFAKKYFGSETAMGKAFTLGNGAFKVTGVIDKVPDNSHFHYDAFISMSSNKYAMTGTTWSNIGFYTYFLLDKNADPKKLEAKFPELIAKYVAPEGARDMGISLAEARKEMSNWNFYLMPVTDIHLHSNTKYELGANSDIQYVYIFGALAVFILLLACVNFTNLSTASSAKRSREVGIRKVLGSVKDQLVTQFLTESVLLTFCAMIFALLFVYLLLPSFNDLSGKNISILFFLNYKALIAAVALIFFVGIVAGIYPAFFLSSFHTISVLKGASSNTPAKRSGLRSGLIVFQFIISTALIIATIVVYQQLHFMQNKKLGYDKEQVLVLQDTYGLDSNQYAFKQKLLSDSRVLNATISRDVPVGRGEREMDGSEVYAKENKANENASEIHANFFHVDYDYTSTLGMKIVAGRNFSKDFHGDSSGAVVINEAAVRDLGWKDNNAALNKTIISSGRHEYNVIGVVQDFNYASAKQKIAPVMMMLKRNSGAIMVKVKTAGIESFLADVKKDWKGYNARTPFSYYFLDDKFASMYAAEEKTGQIFTMFAVIAVLIASLGLFGLVAFTTEQRTKEIGIRKVLGASINQVLVLLSKEFLLLVCIAFIISIPITWWAMHNWLNNFAYRINISWWIFLIAGSLAALIALMAISFLAIKAAVANPVKSLRTE
ncbi:MAG TPA: ABC transporter permease [Puia sp.]|nr:ABC transporter permease [Puia sp.]